VALRTEAIGQGPIQAPDLLAPHLRAALARGSQVLLLHSREEGEEGPSLAMGAMNLTASMLTGEGLKDTTQERALKEVQVVDSEEEEGLMVAEGDFLRVAGEVTVTIMEVILMEQEAEAVQGDLWAHEDLGEGPEGEVGGRGDVFRALSEKYKGIAH